jgi:hypothetical protein
MERIERDLSEISNLRSTLQNDREYTSRLQGSLQDETVRLRELQAKILTQVIQNPPESLERVAAATAPARLKTQAGRTAPSRSMATEEASSDQRAPEIIIPAGKAGGVSPAPRETKPAPARSAKNKRGNAAEATDAANPDDDKAADESFNFTFVQK